MKICFKLPIPFTKTIPEGGHYNHVLAYRKAIWFRLDLTSLSFGIVSQLFSNDSLSWSNSNGYYVFSINFERWRLGRTHDYYDGPHDSFSVGCIHFNWQGEWCNKCMPHS